jgi:hypothetical protein
MAIPGLPDIALSVRQPWAWGIIYGGKDIENRTQYSVTLGGMKKAIGRRICIHASNGMTKDEYESFADFSHTIGVDVPHPRYLRMGEIIGTVEVLDIVRASPSKWFFGPCGLVLRNPEPLVERCVVRGALGLFEPHQVERVDVAIPKWMREWPVTSEHKRSAGPVAAQMPLFDGLGPSSNG